MNALIYGKNEIERIVSVEPRDSDVELFLEMEDGSLKSEVYPMTWYILFAEQLDSKFRRLKGNQYYRYTMEYNSREKYQDVLSKCYKKRYPLYTVRDAKEAVMVKDGYTYYKGMKVEDVSVMSFDIEDTCGIGETLRRDGQVLLIATTLRKRGVVTRKQFAIDEYATEAEMLRSFSTYVRTEDPSILIGHNVFGHDLKVLNFVAKKNGVHLALGRDGSEMEIAYRPSQFRKDGSQAYDYNNIHIYGREIVDTWFLALKYDVAARREYESHGLKYIIAHEGLESKNRQHYDASLIAQNWKKPDEWKKIKAYNVDDADDPLKYFDLTIPSFFYYTQSVPRSLQANINTATGSQINSLMVRAYLQQDHSIAIATEKQDFEGAISFGVPGIHKNVFKIDVQSLYPSIILSKRICNREKDPQELFLKLVDYFTQERIRNKELGESTGERYYKDLSDSQKIMINSAYGFLGAGKLNYNYPAGAAEVTRIGREILKKAILWASGKEYVPVLEADSSEDDDAA
jgi:DNA polymerase I